MDEETARQTASISFDRSRGTDPVEALKAGAEQYLSAQNLRERAQAIPMSEMGERFKKTFNEAPDTIAGVFKAYAKDPVGGAAFLAETVGEFAPVMAGSAAITALTGNPSLGVGTMSAGSYLIESTSASADFLSQKGLHPRTPEEAAAILSDENLMREARDKGFAKGMPIALLDMISGGVAGKALFKSGVADFFAQTTLQAGLGGGGEALGEISAGEPLSPKNIALEAAGEYVSSPLEIYGVARDSWRGNAKTEAPGQSIPPTGRAAPRLPGVPAANPQAPRPDLPVTQEQIDSPIQTGLLQTGAAIMDAAVRGDPLPTGVPEGATPASVLFGDVADDASAAEAPVEPVPAPAAPAVAEQAPEAAPEAGEPPVTNIGQAPETFTTPEPGDTELIDPDALEVDAKRFQFKAGGDAEGVTSQLRGVKEWNTDFSGLAVVWEDKAGKRFIVDGHQRLGLAKRLKAEGQDPKVRAVVMREADGVSAEDARFYGAMKNLAEGGESTAALDVARVFRDGGSPEKIAAQIPPGRKAYRDGEALAKLGDDAWGMVINETVDPAMAAEVGRLLADPAQQTAALGYMARVTPRNINEARLIVEQIREAGFSEATQDGLFGPEAFAETLIGERARILDNSTKFLRQLGRVFKTTVDSSAILTAAGNVLDADANAKGMSENQRLGAAIEKLAQRKGPISDALNEQARALKAGSVTPAQARQAFLDVVRGLESFEAGPDHQSRPADSGGAGADPQEVGGADVGEGVRPGLPGLAGGESASGGGRDSGPVRGGAATPDNGGESSPRVPTRTGTEEGGAIDLTPAGAQTVIPGAEKIPDRELGERGQAKPMQGGNAAPAEDGLFGDPGNRGDLFDAPPKAESAPETGSKKPSSENNDFDSPRAYHEAIIAGIEKRLRMGGQVQIGGNYLKVVTFKKPGSTSDNLRVSESGLALEVREGQKWPALLPEQIDGLAAQVKLPTQVATGLEFRSPAQIARTKAANAVAARRDKADATFEGKNTDEIEAIRAEIFMASNDLGIDPWAEVLGDGMHMPDATYDDTMRVLAEVRKRAAPATDLDAAFMSALDEFAPDVEAAAKTESAPAPADKKPSSETSDLPAVTIEPL